MSSGFRPVGSALPPRRDAVVTVEASAAAPIAPAESWGIEDSIVVPAAQDRLLELIEREQLPNDVRYTLGGALSGDLRRQQLLFQAMVDTWPRLQKCLREVRLAVRKAPWKVQPWAERGSEPTPQAQQTAREIEHDLWSMRPDPARAHKGLEGTLEEIAIGYFFGHHVLEVNWERDGRYRPKSTKIVPPRFYGYPYESGEEDRLMFDSSGQLGAPRFEDFPEHKFLLAVNGGHPGHPTVAAPLRVLSTYWLAAVLGFKWLTQFAQICGIPFRWAEYSKGDNAAKAAVSEMLAKIGTAGWGAFPAGTKVNFVDVGKNAGDIGQKVLLDVANDACSEFILGQNLTTSSGEKGTQALGTVHEGVRQELIEGICDFAGEVVSYQLIPSMVELNYGETHVDIPGFWAQFEKPRDLKAEAERFAKLKELGMRIGSKWAYETLGVPVPGEGEDLLFQVAEPVVDPLAKPEPVQASDSGGGAKWEEFEGSLGIPRAEMPQIDRGNRAAMVQFLRARGVSVTGEGVKPESLMPSQADFRRDKVDAIRAAIRDRSFRPAPLLVSADDRLLDGHHQWLALTEEGVEEIPISRVSLPAARALMLLHRMPSTTVAASIREDYAEPDIPLTVDQLSSAVLEGLTGVSREWLGPVRPVFERLAALAMAKQVTDDDFLSALEKGRRDLPELFDSLNTQVLEEALYEAISSAALAGSTSRYEKP